MDENGTVADEGILDDNVSLENGSCFVFDKATIRIPEASTATRYTLVLTLEADDVPEISNRWDVYAYPKAAAKNSFDGKTIMTSGSGAAALRQRYDNVTDWENGAEPDLLITFDRLTDAQLTYLKNGGKVLYLGTGSEAVTVEKGTFYSQYVMNHSSDRILGNYLIDLAADYLLQTSQP